MKSQPGQPVTPATGLLDAADLAAAASDVVAGLTAVLFLLATVVVGLAALRGGARGSMGDGNA